MGEIGEVTDLSKGEILIIDGGMGGELTKRSGRTGGLWSAQALLDDPELVSTVHAEYIASGAKVIITNAKTRRVSVCNPETF